MPSFFASSLGPNRSAVTELSLHQPQQHLLRQPSPSQVMLFPWLPVRSVGLQMQKKVQHHMQPRRPQKQRQTPSAKKLLVPTLSIVRSRLSPASRESCCCQDRGVRGSRREERRRAASRDELLARISEKLWQRLAADQAVEASTKASQLAAADVFRSRSCAMRAWQRWREKFSNNAEIANGRSKGSRTFEARLDGGTSSHVSSGY